LYFFFFFSSRRRHTRFSRDWSSDVCSSDLMIHFHPDTGLPLRNVPPGDEFIFGTNAIGQDLWSRLWSGTRTSLFIGFVVGVAEALIGITIGSLWGYVRWLERLFTELYNVLDNIPNTVIMVLMTYV